MTVFNQKPRLRTLLLAFEIKITAQIEQNIEIQWNPVNLNTDTKGARRNVCIIRMSVLSGLSEKRPDTCFIDTKIKADMFTAAKRFVTATSAD